jgi:hypothetical protein
MTRRWLLAAAMALLAAPVAAQPVFDESRGFRVLGVTGGDGLLVENGDSAFLCRVTQQGTARSGRYYLLDGCAPIIGPDMAAQIENPEANREAFERLLRGLPMLAFAPMVRQTLREMGCVADMRADSAAPFYARLAERVARSLGFSQQVDFATIQLVREVTSPTVGDMIERGQLVWSKQRRTLQLVNCRR